MTAAEPFQIQAFGATHVGQVRSRNEDKYLIDASINLFIVCDGMGGHAAGDVASDLASRLVGTYLREHRQQIASAGNRPDGDYQVLRLAEQAVEHASTQLYQMARSDTDCSGMGTTLTLLVIVGDKGVMAHVGDSRLYLRRNQKVHQLSSDHTLANELVQGGMLSPQDSRESRYNHILTRSIGPQTSVEVETLLFDLLPGDVFLLCTDGLTKYVDEEDEILEVLSHEITEQSARQLVETANRKGGADNITVIVVEVQPRPDAAVLNSDEFQRRLDVMKSVFLFRGLSLSRLMRLMNIAKCQQYQAGERIFSEGETGRQLSIVLSGTVTYGPTTYRAGDSFGEASVFCDERMHFDLVAEQAVELLSIEGADFQALTRRFPKLGRRLLSVLARHLSEQLQIAREAGEDLLDTWTE